MSTIAIAFFFISASPSFEIILLCKTFKAEFQIPLNTSEGRHHDCRVDSQGQSWPLTKKLNFSYFMFSDSCLKCRFLVLIPGMNIWNCMSLQSLHGDSLLRHSCPLRHQNQRSGCLWRWTAYPFPLTPLLKDIKLGTKKKHLENRFFPPRITETKKILEF